MTLTAESEVHTYSRSPSILASAAEAFGLTVEREQVADWEYLIASAYELDNILDGTGSQAEREAAYDLAARERLILAPQGESNDVYSQEMTQEYKSCWASQLL
ncbi:hypothetical protein EKI60_00645 [Candidatus Saccharibacteria bacterium]|nr:MAG: hypothetical protein EKI60_00645 [Candidatus Saccharibacteria bacterium]